MKSVARLIAAALLVSGCDHPLDVPAPSYGAGNPPPASGRVVRFQEGSFAFLNFDPATNLSSVIGLPDDPATSLPPFCSGPGAFEVLDWQAVMHPEGPVNTLIRAGSVNVHVYDATPFNAAFEMGDLCGAVSLPRLAEGEARLQYTDNDFDVTGTRANAFGWRVQGILVDPSTGDPVRYLDVLHGILRPTDAFEFTVSTVRLSPRAAPD